MGARARKRHVDRASKANKKQMRPYQSDLMRTRIFMR